MLFFEQRMNATQCVSATAELLVLLVMDSDFFIMYYNILINAIIFLILNGITYITVMLLLQS